MWVWNQVYLTSILVSQSLNNILSSTILSPKYPITLFMHSFYISPFLCVYIDISFLYLILTSNFLAWHTYILSYNTSLSYNNVRFNYNTVTILNILPVYLKWHELKQLRRWVPALPTKFLLFKLISLKFLTYKNGYKSKQYGIGIKTDT